MAKRKTAGKDKPGAADFASFMAQVTKNVDVIDLGAREENFYRLGDYNLDRALGGGLPSGQIYAFQGPHASGKSLAALTVAKQVLASDPETHVAYFDTESKISKKALDKMGLGSNPNFNHLTIDNLEDMIDTAIQMAESGFFKLIVIDSLDSLVTDEQEERDIHDGSKVGGYKAKLLSEWLPSVTHAASTNDCAMLFVQQIRLNPGAMFANPEVTSGGEAIKFYTTTRLRFGPNKEGNQEVDGKLVYQGATVKVLKSNQGAVPKDAVKIRFYIGDEGPWGIDPVNSLVDEAVRLRVLPPKNATSHIYIACDELCAACGVDAGKISFNGRNNLLKALTNDEDFREAVQEIVDERLADPSLIDEADEEVITDYEEIDE